MIKRIFLRVLPLILGVNLILALPTTYAETTPAPAIEKPMPVFRPVTPGPGDGQIAQSTMQMLQQFHYLRQRFDSSLSVRFLDRYLDALDPQHMHFLQSDLAQFERYRTNLDNLTRAGDTRPACEVFNRYMERLQQRATYAEELLKTEQFTFDTDERITINRHESPYPKDLAEAKALWRDRLRFEFLQERLAKLAPKPSDKNKTEVSASDSADGKPKVISKDIVDILTRRYNRTIRTFIDWNNEDVLQIYLTTLAHVYDPHSDYFGRSQLESFAIGMNLSLFGIGAELQSEDGYCTIRRVLPNGPAEKSKKIKERDRIIAVAQGDNPAVDVVDMSLSKAVQLIRGAKGTEVRLTIIPANADASATEVVTLVRDEIKLEDQEAKARVIELPKENGETLRLGVIDLPSFYATFDVGSVRRMELANARGDRGSKSTTADVSRLLEKLKKEHIDGVVLDLRRNGGGSLDEAIKLTGLFIKEGPVVQVRNWKNDVEEMQDTDSSSAYDGPLVVLTSRFSASASEILAGALQDYGRALIVGDSSTHGKGTVQSVNPLPPPLHMSEKLSTNDPGALKVTIKKFYRASGASTQLKGVVPDIVLPSVFNESKDIGETALENPLAWDTIPSAKFEALNMVSPYLPNLRKRSAERISSDKDFDYVREDIEQYRKLQADKTVSLNEKQRIQEKEEADARQKARDKERLARKDPQEKIYELTLRQVDLPGLPPPLEKTNSVARLALKGASSGVSTNSAVASAAKGTAADLNDDGDDEKPPAIDATLTETEHILVDYVAALRKLNLTTAGRPTE
jgi:carboxyl-terminal processing protease